MCVHEVGCTLGVGLKASSLVFMVSGMRHQKARGHVSGGTGCRLEGGCFRHDCCSCATVKQYVFWWQMLVGAVHQ